MDKKINISDLEYLIGEVLASSEEELIQNAKKWWEVHDKINFLDWNEKLRSVSYPFYDLKIDPELIEKSLNGEKESTLLIKNLLDEKLSELGLSDSFFIKLITRSPKDWFEDSFECKSAEDGVNAVFGSMRCFDDLCFLFRIDKCIFIIRPFINIPKEREFRVFVENKKIIAISQYHYFEKHEWTAKNHLEIESRIRSFVDSIVTENLDLDNYVADIVIEDDKEILLELNPFGLSDPCLFTYENMDGSFKF